VFTHATAVQEPGRDTDGSTCLHLAVLSGQDKLVRLLLTHGAEREATNKVGSTSLTLLTCGIVVKTLCGNFYFF
jgi:ankyrin repeat protein